MLCNSRLVTQRSRQHQRASALTSLSFGIKEPLQGFPCGCLRLKERHSNKGNYPLPIITLCFFFSECSNYKFLNDSSRAVTYNHSVLMHCNDSINLLGWYRFGGEAGTQMADNCVKISHCGSWYPGSLSGGHPSVSDGAVMRKVCFTGYSGCCQYSTFISVRNCYGFYIYKLSPIHLSYYCYLRYCSSYGFKRPTTSTSGTDFNTVTHFENLFNVLFLNHRVSFTLFVGKL